MAEPDLIADYLRSLRECLRWRPDAADLIDEAEDHLRLSAERIARECGDPLEAQRLTLTRFGDPAVVARAFATAGGLTMPTPFTRTAGKLAVFAALGWLALAVVGAYATGASPVLRLHVRLVLGRRDGGRGRHRVALVGMLVRAGERSGPWMFAAVALSCLSLAAAAVMTWGIVMWGLLIWLTCAIALGRMRAAGVTTRPLDWALFAAWPASLGLWVLVDQLELGPLDTYGEYPAAAAAGVATLGVLMAVGLLSVGRRLAAEVPADLPARDRTGLILLAPPHQHTTDAHQLQHATDVPPALAITHRRGGSNASLRAQLGRLSVRTGSRTPNPLALLGKPRIHRCRRGASRRARAPLEFEHLFDSIGGPR